MKHAKETLCTVSVGGQSLTLEAAQPWHVGGPLLTAPGTGRLPAKRIDPSAPADTNRSLQV